MAELKPGTTMARIAELERITAELARVTRELTGRLDLAERRICDLEAAARPLSGDEPW